jgi:hypothetical protein
MVNNAELLLALRAPDTGWLAVLACVLDEASQDPAFDARQRDLVVRLLDHGPLAPALLDAAQQRAARFEAELNQPAPAPARPELTLVRHGLGA